MKQPVDHILRPHLPWRDGPGMTECGLDASKAPTLTREQYAVRRKEMGDQRSALFTCMTCRDTCQRHGTWEDDPRQALAREIAWESPWRTRRGECGEPLKDELLAIAALIAAHPDEFAAHVAATEGRREWLAKKAASAAVKSKPVRQPGGL